ncbi:MAG TPA: insulinase family protein [Allosphingosinicella sp.]|nr:insulinase family protein [Allosphingosinicella sp.]
MRLLAAFAALALAAGAPAQTMSPEARHVWGFDGSDLTPDPRIRFGVLANGMRYAILPNRTPARAVAFRLLVRVGAADGAPGEAHYLEHMAFMGSRRIPEGARASLERREHLRLGTDFNAHTGDTDTYYRIDLARPDRRQLERMLLLLRDIGDGLLLVPEAMERARAEIVAEARQRSGPEDRRERDQIAFFLPGTRIAQTTLTGSETEAAAVSVEGLSRLYGRYYEPRRTTLIVVGDVDPAWLETRIAAEFDHWPVRASLTDSPPGPIDRARPSAFRALTTPGGSTWATVASVAPLGGGDASAPRDQGFLQSLGADMLAARVLGHRGGDRPFMDAEAAVETYYRTARISRFSVRAFDGDWRMALGVAEQELRCALRDGFSEDEFAIAIEREGERLATYTAPETSGELANRLTEMIGIGIVPTQPGRAADTRAYLAGIRLDAVNSAFRAAWAAPGRLVHVANDRPIEGGEAALAQVWAAGAPCR